LHCSFPQGCRLISQQTSIRADYHGIRILYIEVIPLKDKKSKQLNKEVFELGFGQYATAPEMASSDPVVTSLAGFAVAQITGALN
jgi:hypothetical protein